MRIKLEKGDMLLELDPAAGGAVSALKHRDLNVLRAAPDRCGPAFEPLQYAAFPMVPFVGRIHNGLFRTQEQSVQLHPNLPPEPHAIHGYGWKTAWLVEVQTSEAVTLLHRHEADAWPWDYEARQTFRVEGSYLLVDLSVTNLGATPMPAGLGWHPYFYRAEASIALPTTHVWHPDEVSGDNTPHEILCDADLTIAAPVEDLKLDTTFSVASPEIKLEWPTHAVTLRSDPIFSHATIYIPPREDFFCAEPITHAPNSVNGTLSPDITGQKWLEPGQKLSGSIRLEIDH